MEHTLRKSSPLRIVVTACVPPVSFPIHFTEFIMKINGASSHGKVDGKQKSHSQASKTQSRSKRRRRSQEDISSVEVLEVVVNRLWKKLSQTALGQGVHQVSSSALPDITP